MRRAIIDEFTHLNISRQRKYQLRKQRDARCIICGQRAVSSTFCLKHLSKNRERVRKLNNSKRRHRGALSYRLDKRVVLPVSCTADFFRAIEEEAVKKGCGISELVRRVLKKEIHGLPEE
jgi:hypothetical protein